MQWLRRLMTRIPFLLSAGIALADGVAPPQWGHLKGRVLLKGDIPTLNPVAKAGIDAGVEFDVPDDSLVVDLQSKGIANVAVYLLKPPAQIHPESTKDAEEAKLVIRHYRFEPHMILARVGQTIRITRTKDAQTHFMTSPLKGQRVIAGIGTEGTTLQFAVPEPIPVLIEGSCQNFARAWALVLDHPYGAISGTDGTFEIKHLPAGVHEFRIWHERMGWVRPPSDEKFFKVTIKPDEMTTLDIAIPVERLMEKK